MKQMIFSFIISLLVLTSVTLPADEEASERWTTKVSKKITAISDNVHLAWRKIFPERSNADHADPEASQPFPDAQKPSMWATVKGHAQNLRDTVAVKFKKVSDTMQERLKYRKAKNMIQSMSVHDLPSEGILDNSTNFMSLVTKKYSNLTSTIAKLSPDHRIQIANILIKTYIDKVMGPFAIEKDPSQIPDNRAAVWKRLYDKLDNVIADIADQCGFTKDQYNVVGAAPLWYQLVLNQPAVQPDPAAAMQPAVAPDASTRPSQRVINPDDI